MALSGMEGAQPRSGAQYETEVTASKLKGFKAWAVDVAEVPGAHYSWVLGRLWWDS